jgi:hypothetical protein
MMCEDPAVKDVKRKTLPSLSHALRSCAEAMSMCVYGSAVCSCLELCRELGMRVFTCRGFMLPLTLLRAALCGVSCFSCISEHEYF